MFLIVSLRLMVNSLQASIECRLHALGLLLSAYTTMFNSLHVGIEYRRQALFVFTVSLRHHV